VYERDSVFYQAMKLGGLVTIGLPWQLENRIPERLQQVTAEQVRAVARKYLIDKNLTIAVLQPTKMQAKNERGL